MASDKLRKESQRIVVMKIGRIVQFGLVFSVVCSSCCLLTVHDSKHCVNHDSFGSGGFKGGVIICSYKLACVSVCSICHCSRMQIFSP